MKRIFLTLALTLFSLLFFTVVALSQPKPKKSKLIVFHDKFQNVTTVSTNPRKPKNTLGILVSGYFNHDTELLRKPVVKVGLVFDSYSSNWKFLRGEDRRLFVLADGERLEFDSPSRDSSVNRGYGPYSRVSVSERLIFSLDREILAKLLSARSLEMRLGIYGRSFSLGNETLSELRELINRMMPQP